MSILLSHDLFFLYGVGSGKGEFPRITGEPRVDKGDLLKYVLGLFSALLIGQLERDRKAGRGSGVGRKWHELDSNPALALMLRAFTERPL